MQPAKKQKATPRADRRASFAAYIYLRTGIDESMIERLINSFYARTEPTRCWGRFLQPAFKTGHLLRWPRSLPTTWITGEKYRTRLHHAKREIREVSAIVPGTTS
jgi:hypothetical protein